MVQQKLQSSNKEPLSHYQHGLIVGLPVSEGHKIKGFAQRKDFKIKAYFLISDLKMKINTTLFFPLSN